METRYYILTPEGFPIDEEIDHETPNQAWNEFEDWKKRFERQGYYSTVSRGERIRIPLNKLKDCCELRTRTRFPD